MSRVLVDTNIVISALLFPNSTPARALTIVLDEHRLVLTQWVLDELHEVIGRKRPDLLPALETFLEGIDCELVEPGLIRRLRSPTPMISRSLTLPSLLPSTCWSRATRPFSDSISCSRE